MEYNTGNFDKYMTKNPLKQKLISRLNERIIDIVKEYSKELRLNEGSVNILDAGCGEGFISKLIYSSIPNVSITGLEKTEEALEIAKDLISEVAFIQGDIMRIPFDDNSFDIVLCTEVLEHLPKPDEALKELLRVTRNIVILTVPNEPWFCMGNLASMKNVSRLGNPIDHINHWTNLGFKKFLSDNSNEEWIIDGSFPWTIARCSVDKGKEVG